MNTQNCKLLVVDDEAFNREILEEMLTSVGYIVEMAADGEKAWQMLDSGKHIGKIGLLGTFLSARLA